MLDNTWSKTDSQKHNFYHFFHIFWRFLELFWTFLKIFGTFLEIFGSKSDFLRKVTPKSSKYHWFHKGLASWAQKSDFGAKKCKKCPKVTFCSKITKSDPRRQPAFPLAKNTLQRSTPGKKILSDFHQKYDFNAKIIFVIKIHFHVKNWSSQQPLLPWCTLASPYAYYYIMMQQFNYL